MVIITCLIVFILQVIMSLIRVSEIKYCVEHNRQKMVSNAFYGSVITLISFTIGISPLIKIFNEGCTFNIIDIFAPISFVAGSVFGKYLSTFIK